MQQQGARRQHALNYYQILGLTPPSRRHPASWSHEELKTAYHRTLLLHHPDKVPKHVARVPTEDQLQPSAHRLTVDDIVLAYQTLANSKLRKEYDSHMLRDVTRADKVPVGASQKGTHLGVETYDLDDLKYDEELELWSRSCRCGNGQGYTVTEDELEGASEDGEIYVGCHGCSLFIKVLFNVVVEDGNTAQVLGTK